MKNKIIIEPNRFDVDIKNGLNKKRTILLNGSKLQIYY